jgi:sialidase-1
MAGRVAYYGGITSTGLVFDLDPARKNSYNGLSTSVTDLSSIYTGSLVGGVTWSNENKGVFKFDGIDEIIDLGTVTPNVYPGTGNFTWTGWLKYGSFTGTYRHIWYGSAGGGNNGLGIFLADDANQIGIEVRGTLGPAPAQRQRKFTTVTSYLNTWNHYAFVLNTADYTILVYINGVLVSTHICENWGSINRNGSASLIIGNHQAGTWFYNGYIGPIQLYRRVLSSTEVLQNYDALKGRFS